MLDSFERHSLVILNLVNPKEKFWGILFSINAVGITLKGINLDSFDDWVRQIARGTDEDATFDLVTMFVPLFRVERIFLDERVGSIKSYSDFFLDVVGKSPLQYYGIGSAEEKIV